MADEKPFYIRQLPKEAQDWLRDKAYNSFLGDGEKEEDARQKAEDFLDEKVYTAEEMYGKDFLNEVGKAEEDKKEKPEPADDGGVEVDELSAYTKDLEDYMGKNKKGRDDIPTVTTRR